MAKLVKMIIGVACFFIALSSSVAAEQNGTLFVKINFINDRYSIAKAWIIEKNFPALNAPTALADDLQFQLLDVNNNVIAKVRARNPRIIRSALLSPEEVKTQEFITNNEHQYIIQTEGSFILRFALTGIAGYVDLIDDVSTVVVNGSAAQKSNILQRMDLSSHLPDQTK